MTAGRSRRSTLGNERVSIGGGVGGIFPAMDLIVLLEIGGERVPGASARIGAILAKDHALKVLNLRRAQRAVIGTGPGPEGNVTKLVLAEHGHDRARLQADLVGPADRLPRRRGRHRRVRPSSPRCHVDRGRDVRDHPQPDRRAHPRAAPGPADQVGPHGIVAHRRGPAKALFAPRLLREATRSQPSCDAGMTRRVVPCSRGAGWDRHEGGAVQASVRAVETRNVPTAGAALATPWQPGPPTPQRRLSARTIELVGLALGIGFITAVALGRDLSNDEFWQVAAG